MGSESASEKPNPAPAEQEKSLAAQASEALDQFNTKPDQANIDKAKKLLEKAAAQDALKNTTSGDLENLAKKIQIPREKLKGENMDAAKNALGDVLEKADEAITLMRDGVRSDISELFNNVKEGGAAFMATVKEKGIMAAVSKHASHLGNSIMKLFDSFKSFLAFSAGPFLGFIGLEKMVGRHRILLATALKSREPSIEKIESNTGDSKIIRQLESLYGQHFGLDKQLPIEEEEYYQRVVSKLPADVSGSVTPEQLLAAAKQVVNEQIAAQKAAAPAAAPSAATPATPTVAPAGSAAQPPPGPLAQAAPVSPAARPSAPSAS